ncbi:nucleoside deaminase [Candidatus Saccharibacteria bacterium]|nr:nucleoside deaminase [Candidatus Saccharibacteria bacterium]
MNGFDGQFMRRAMELAREGMDNGAGGPFGAVVVKDDRIISEGSNEVASTNDPTAHAEIVAIRRACQNLNSFQLTDCDIYATCEPCPMCLGAIYWARPRAVYFAATRDDAAAIGFDDAFIYEQIPLPHNQRTIPQIYKPNSEIKALMGTWHTKTDKVEY